MSTSEPASDTFIGRLFKRIAPGSSYAAFPWKSWDKVCTILETIRGRGCRIKRSHKDNEWEIDATDGTALDKPHAYSVFVLDIEAARERAEELPASMMSDISNSDLENGAKIVFVYCPYVENSRDDVLAGVNGLDMTGKIGDLADEEFPEGSHWGWRRIGEFYNDDPMVVYGQEFEGRFEDISIGTEGDFLSETSVYCSCIIPIAWIIGNRIIQTLLGRPWDVKGEVSKAVITGADPGHVVQDGLLSVRLYGTGLESAKYANATLSLTEVCQGASLPTGSVLLAHRAFVRTIQDTSES